MKVIIIIKDNVIINISFNNIDNKIYKILKQIIMDKLIYEKYYKMNKDN